MPAPASGELSDRERYRRDRRVLDLGNEAAFLKKPLEACPTPERFLGVPLEAWDPRPEGAREVLEACRAFVADPKGAAPFLIGPSGTGKTYAAHATLNAIKAVWHAKIDAALEAAVAAVRAGDLSAGLGVAKPPSIIMESGATLAGGLRSAVGSDSVERFMKVRAEAGILLLDDLDVMRVSDFVAEHFFGIVDARYGRKLPTLCTSNLGLEELRGVLGDRVVRRLVDLCEVRVVRGAGVCGGGGVPAQGRRATEAKRARGIA